MSRDQGAYDAGLALRREMFGEAGADKAVAAASDFAAPLQEIVTRFCFGEIWQRDGLDRKTRSMLTLAMLMASGRFAQFGGHVHGAIANGVSEDELRELILHGMLYCGIPATVEATGICDKIFTTSTAS